MKKVIVSLLAIFIISGYYAFAQDTTGINNKVIALEQRVTQLENQTNNLLERIIALETNKTIFVPAEKVKKITDSKTEKTVKDSYDGTTRQCKAITQKGTRCKRNTTDPSGYCWQHKR